MLETPLEHTLASFNKTRMLSYMEANPSDFKELIRLSLSDKQPYSWRAAWLLRSCTEKNDPRLKNHLSKVINKLSDLNDAQNRDWFFVLNKMEIKEKDEGLLFDTCVNVWCSIEKKPSTRHNAFRVIVKLVKKHPELYDEALLLTDEKYIEPLSPGIKKVIQRMIKNLRK